MIPIFILIVAAVFGLLHFAVFKALVSVFSIQNSQISNWLLVVFIILGSSFIIFSVVSNYSDNSFTRIGYTLSAVWFGVVVLMFLAACLYGVVVLIGHLISPDFQTRWFGMALLGIAITAGIYGLFHANSIVIREESVTIPGLPVAWQGTRAVVITDLHLGQVRGQGFVEEIVKKIAEIKPDIVFIPGDIFDGPKINAIEALSPFRDLQTKRGIYVSTGNHDEFGSYNSFLDAISQAGIKVLDNKNELIDGVQIIGVNNKDSGQTSHYTGVLSALNIGEQPSILLKHQPTLLEISEKAGIDLQISGHTHRGQFIPFNFITSFIFKGYDFGLKKFGNMDVLVSSGIGTWGMPMRIGTDSEIVILNFK